MSSKANENFTSMSNAVFRDQEIRAVNNPDVWRELKKSQTLGLAGMNILAIACKLALLIRAGSVEKVRLLHEKLNTAERVATITPNLDKSSNRYQKWEEIEDEEKETSDIEEYGEIEGI